MNNGVIGLFKEELKALLGKYNAEIYFDCSDTSDTYAIYNPRIMAKIDGKRTKLSNDWNVRKTDIK